MIILWNSAAMNVELVVINGTTHVHHEWEAGRELARDMLRYVQDRLAEKNKTIHDIQAIGVYQGPGSFTGLRIGLTVLNTIAQSLQIPIVGVTGEDWRTVALARLEAGEDDRIVLPVYAREAHTTTPRK